MNRQTLYAVSKYEFQAIGPDELDMFLGEVLIPVAESTWGWIVVKPINRLGGPGFVPASWIEIKDASTGKTVPTDMLRALDVPTVSQWKNRVASYQASCIRIKANARNTKLQPKELKLAETHKTVRP